MSRWGSFLIPYGKAIQVLEPPLLKERLVAITFGFAAILSEWILP
jgi:predicted DNA-binding transcriptional regulator YafY